ncbi:MAG: hypothetical protein JW750_04495 [Anaerolineaceae bacterium]|nr:hypothetical protein [Anaerolineaceae bacterium]
MQADVILLMARNVLFSWVIHIEFAAPVLIWLAARHRRKYHPRLTRFIRYPALLLLLAGLIKQVYQKAVLPWALWQSRSWVFPLADLIWHIVYAVLLLGGFGLLLWSVYYQRRVTPEEAPFGTVKDSV